MDPKPTNPKKDEKVKEVIPETPKEVKQPSAERIALNNRITRLREQTVHAADKQARDHLEELISLLVAVRTEADQAQIGA